MNNTHKLSIVNRLLYTVAYRCDVNQWLCKQQPLLCKAHNIHAHDNRRTVFSMWSAPIPLLCNGAVNTSTTIQRLRFLRHHADELSWRLALQLGCGIFAGQQRRERGKLKPLLGNGWWRRQAGKGLADAVVNCKIVEISDSAVITCASESWL
jgi:hypothetical protein